MPPAHLLFIGLITDIIQSYLQTGAVPIASPGRCPLPFQIRIVPLSTDPRPASMGNAGNAAPQAECPFPPTLSQHLSNAHSPFPFDRSITFRLHIPQWSHLIVLHYALLPLGLLKHTLNGLVNQSVTPF